MIYTPNIHGICNTWAHDIHIHSYSQCVHGYVRIKYTFYFAVLIYVCSANYDSSRRKKTASKICTAIYCTVRYHMSCYFCFAIELYSCLYLDVH